MQEEVWRYQLQVCVIDIRGSAPLVTFNRCQLIGEAAADSLAQPPQAGAVPCEVLGEATRPVLGLGLGALAHANWHATTHCQENDYWAELSVLQAAHAAEVLIKARIAEEHPLLIFEQLPGLPADAAPLNLAQLIERGRTYHELPDRLWACTHIQLPNIELYRRFGRLRNTSRLPSATLAAMPSTTSMV
jgi:hypothetical protein